MNRRAFAKHFPTFVISLERTPHRLTDFRRWNAAADLEIEVFNAVDGRTLDIGAVDPAILKPGTTCYKAGSVGSAMSHRALWQRCAAGEKPFLIFEDDAAIRGDVRDVLPALVDGLEPSWELFLLGYNTDVLVEVAMADDLNMRLGFSNRYPEPADLARFTAGRSAVGVGRLTLFFGLCGYLISPAGARSLLIKCFPLELRTLQVAASGVKLATNTLDIRIDTHLPFVRAYACVPPLVMPDNRAATSAKAGKSTPPFPPSS